MEKKGFKLPEQTAKKLKQGLGVFTAEGKEIYAGDYVNVIFDDKEIANNIKCDTLDLEIQGFSLRDWLGEGSILEINN